MNDKKKKAANQYNRLEPVDVWHFYLKNDWLIILLITQPIDSSFDNLID